MCEKPPRAFDQHPVARPPHVTSSSVGLASNLAATVDDEAPELFMGALWWPCYFVICHCVLWSNF